MSTFFTPSDQPPADDPALTLSRPAPGPARSLSDLLDRAHAELDGMIVGHEEPLDLLLIAAVAGGHVLVEGPPGVAKTLMAGAVARLLGGSFRRVQFTPDTTPQEIAGRSVTRLGEAVFSPGAVFTNVLLADEINRTPPRTQAALLEAMQERHVTVDGRTHWLPVPFMVVATQNPFEQGGIFPLPESQLDRFLFKITLGYASAEEERAIMRVPHRALAPDVLGDIQPLLDVASLDAAQQELDLTAAPDDVIEFVVDLARTTRHLDGVILGASPRAAIHLLGASKAHARLSKRFEVSRDDVIAMAQFVLAHRLVVEGRSAKDVVDEALAAASA
jgi:MoxR-like ATPase